MAPLLWKASFRRGGCAVVLIAAGLAVSLLGATAADAPAPATVSGASAAMLADTCAGCHGTDGASRGPATPIIGGLHADYIVAMMTGYASGAIASTVMGRIAKGYTTDEIARLAEHFAAQPFVAARQDFDPASAARGASLHEQHCEKCHSNGGTGDVDDAEDTTGHLSGQWMPYLRATMTDFLSGARTPPQKMRDRIMKLSFGPATVFDDLFQHYASQQK